MRKRLLRKSHRIKSKRGLSLVELIVGVTIMVIVFGATLSAMANGYSDTINNATRNTDVAKGASINEVIMETIKSKPFENEEECIDYFLGDPNTDENNAIHAAALEADKNPNGEVDRHESIRYVPAADFPNNEYEKQYTVITDARSEIEDISIVGVEIQTAIKTPKGWAINKSFVPYTDQS